MAEAQELFSFPSKETLTIHSEVTNVMGEQLVETSKPATEAPHVTLMTQADDVLIQETMPVSPGTGAETITRTLSPISQIKVNVNMANIRAGPGTDYPIIGYSEKDGLFEVLATDNTKGWYNITFQDNQRGWLGSSVVEVVFLSEEIKTAVTRPAPPSADN